jgi:hypothetical protein
MKIDVCKQTIDIIFAYTEESESRRRGGDDDEMCNGIISTYILVGLAHSYSYTFSIIYLKIVDKRQFFLLS